MVVVVVRRQRHQLGAHGRRGGAKRALELAVLAVGPDLLPELLLLIVVLLWDSR